MSDNTFRLVLEPSGNESDSGAEELLFNLVQVHSSKPLEIDGATDHGIDPRSPVDRAWLHKQLDDYLDSIW